MFHGSRLWKTHIGVAVTEKTPDRAETIRKGVTLITVLSSSWARFGVTANSTTWFGVVLQAASALGASMVFGLCGTDGQHPMYVKLKVELRSRGFQVG